VPHRTSCCKSPTVVPASEQNDVAEIVTLATKKRRGSGVKVRSPAMRSCFCEGSNENCRWCSGTGILPERHESVFFGFQTTVQPRKATLNRTHQPIRESCDKCSFRGTAEELRVHQLAQHSPSECDCPKCDFHGTATELRDHLATYHRPQRGSSSVRKFQFYVCDTCGFRGSEFHVQEHVKQHIVRHYLGWEPPTPPSKKAQAKREQQGKADCRPGYHRLTPADR
jgi:hypothetical protein